MESLNRVSNQFEICPISTDKNLLIACPCPMCGGYYKLGHFCVVRAVREVKEVLHEGEDDGEERYVVGPESVMCVECGHANLKNILFFLTGEEAKEYLDKTAVKDLYDISEYDVDVLFVDVRSYLASLRDESCVYQ